MIFKNITQCNSPSIWVDMPRMNNSGNLSFPLQERKQMEFVCWYVTSNQLKVFLCGMSKTHQLNEK